MKKFKILLSLTLIILLFIPLCMVQISAEEEGATVTLRIESYDKNIYYEKIPLDSTKDVTLTAFLQDIDNKTDTLNIVGLDTGYITEINVVAAGKFGGWDGWLYTINGESPLLGMDAYILQENDVIIIYYGDPFGTAGMQYPTLNDENFLQSGVLKFTSADTTYDEEYNPTVTINPVVGAVITWGYGNNETAQYTTDENGEVTIPSFQRYGGLHSLQISRYTESGLPTVLRFPPDFTYKIGDGLSVSDTTEAVSTTEANTTEAISTTIVENTKTSESIFNNSKVMIPIIIITIIAVAAIIYIIVFNKKNKKV